MSRGLVEVPDKGFTWTHDLRNIFIKYQIISLLTGVKLSLEEKNCQHNPAVLEWYKLFSNILFIDYDEDILIFNLKVDIFVL